MSFKKDEDQLYSKGKYGLLISQKAALKKKKNVFGDDSSDDEEEGGKNPSSSSSTSTDWRKKKLETNAKIKRETALKLEKASAEDPSIFQYDEIYDEMEEKKLKESTLYKNRQENKKPKYINNLLKSAELRNREHERRQERKVQREREAEGDEFKDKEKFVTSAYRKKMEELAAAEEEIKRQDAIDELTDVTKQSDMSGFYRHLYRQTMGQEKGQKEAEETIKKPKINQKSFRSRNNDDEDEDEEEKNNKDKSSDSSSSSSESDQDNKESSLSREEKLADKRQELRKQKEKREARKRKIEMGQNSSSSENEDESDKKVQNKIEPESSGKTKDAVKNERETTTSSTSTPRPKVDIWKKITVGELYEDALQRYLIRKSNRTVFPIILQKS